tara:strand:- start:369 stop:545 length:177 start_codon:yes stop_codon:yes gene_type:complete
MMTTKVEIYNAIFSSGLITLAGIGIYVIGDRLANMYYNKKYGLKTVTVPVEEKNETTQ